MLLSFPNRWLKRDCGSLIAQSCLTLTTLWTLAHQAHLPMGFPRREYGSRLPFPSSGDLPDPGIESGSPALQADSLLTELREIGKAETANISLVKRKRKFLKIDTGISKETLCCYFGKIRTLLSFSKHILWFTVVFPLPYLEGWETTVIFPLLQPLKVPERYYRKTHCRDLLSHFSLNM